MKPRARFLALLILFCPLTQAQAKDSDDRTQFAREMVIGPGETVGDALCFFCPIHVRGVVNVDAVAIGGSIEVEGNVEGDAVAAGGGIRLGPGARVKGDAVAAGGQLERDPKSSIDGDAISNRWCYLPGQRHPTLPGLLVLLAVNVGAVLVAALIVRERRLLNMARTLRARPLLSPLAGVGVLGAAIVLFFISNHLGPAEPTAATIIAFALLVTAVVGFAGLSATLGRALASARGHLVKVVMGAVLIALIQLIPVVGCFAFLVFVVLALGCAALSRYGSTAEELPQFIASQPVVPPASSPSGQ